MRKIAAGVGSLALVAGSAFFVASAYQPAFAADGSSLSASAVTGQWVFDGRYTEWQTSETPPTTGAGEKLGELETLPGTSQVETTDWVTEDDVANHPASDGWVKVDEQGAWTETVKDAEPGFWSNFEPTDTYAPFDGPPVWPTDPRGKWSAPKEDGGPQQGNSGVFQNGSGHGSWYYRQQGTPAETVDHPAMFMFERTVETPAQYRWQILEWVTDGDNGGTDNGGTDTGGTDPGGTDTGDGGQDTGDHPGETGGDNTGGDEVTGSGQPDHEVKPGHEVEPQKPGKTPAAPEAGLPTVIDAGL